LDLITSLNAQLENGFQKTRLQDALAALENEANPFRVRSFFSIFRELAGSVVERLAPVNEVRACPWFLKSQASSNPVMDDDRASFLIHGGISPSDAELELYLDVDLAHATISEALDNIRLFMTVSNATEDVTMSEGELKANAALGALLNMLDETAKARASLAEAFDNVMGDAMDTITGNAISKIKEAEVYRSHGNDGLCFLEVSQLGADTIELLSYSRLNVTVKNSGGFANSRIGVLPSSGSMLVTHRFKVPTDNVFALEVVTDSLSIASIN
jgi:hypothetical protein